MYTGILKAGKEGNVRVCYIENSVCKKRIQGIYDFDDTFIVVTELRVVLQFP